MNIDRTISFRQDMIDLILAGKKTVTIRPIKPQPEKVEEYDGLFLKIYMRWQGEDLSKKGNEWFYKQYPHGLVGDIMAIRERPEVNLKITGVTVDRLHEISHDTWEKDGVSRPHVMRSPLSYYHWQRFYAGTKYEWSNNPFVWVIEFELEKKGKNNENERLFEET